MKRPIATLLMRLLCVGLLGMEFGTVRVHAWAKPPDETKSAEAAFSFPEKTPEDMVARLKQAVDLDWKVSKSRTWRGTRPVIEGRFQTWNGLTVPYFILPALPADQVGKPPADHGGALAVEIIAKDDRITVVSAVFREPETTRKILAALGLTLTQEAESRRRTFGASKQLDLRLAVARSSDQKQQQPLPLAKGPSYLDLEDSLQLFKNEGISGGLRHGDSYHWHPLLESCEVSSALVKTSDDRSSYLLLSDKPEERLLLNSARISNQPFR